LKIKQIVMREAYCASMETSLTEIASMMKRHGIGAVPVCDGDRLMGVITDRDIVVSCVAAGMDASSCKAKEFMTSHPVTVSMDADIEEAAKLMAKEQVRRLPVVDDRRLIGMISLGDVAVALLGNEHLVADTLRRISMPVSSAAIC
jgi:CBS domain-containing protein